MTDLTEMLHVAQIPTPCTHPYGLIWCYGPTYAWFRKRCAMCLAPLPFGPSRGFASRAEKRLAVALADNARLWEPGAARDAEDEMVIEEVSYG